MTAISSECPPDSFAHETAAEEIPPSSSAKAFIIVAYAANPLLSTVKALSGFQRCKLDEESHEEGGRRYYRLRIGFFVTSEQAETALANIRKLYQASFIECLSVPGKPPAPTVASATHAMTGKALPPIDATQTLRALTLRERNDPNEATWYVVQLAASSRPINLATMPRLDIFMAYRLYSVVAQRSAQHFLRLGFFSEEASANMVCQYVAAFFASPSVVRVSATEHARFADPPRREAQSQASGAPPANVIQFSSAREPGATPAATAASPRKAVIAYPTAQQATPSAKRSEPSRPTATRPPSVRKSRSLNEELIEEARRIQTEQTGRHRTSEHSGSWLSRFVGRPKS